MGKRNRANLVKREIKSKSPNFLEPVKQMHQDGISVLKMASVLGVSRPTIVRCIKELGLDIRGGSEANKIRFAKCSRDYIQKLTKKAHDAVRGKKRTCEELVYRAIIHQFNPDRFGKLEKFAHSRLCGMGFNAIHQRPCYVYNLDVGVGPVAVEIHNATGNPMMVPRLRKRIIQLAHLGIATIYIKVFDAETISSSAFDYVATFIDEFSAHPTGRCEYRVIHSDGYLESRDSFDLNDFPDILAPEKSYNIPECDLIVRK